MTRTSLREDDRGKRVLNPDGTVVGRLVGVENGRGYVRSELGLLETLKARLGWSDPTEGAHPLDEGSIAEITDDAVHLRGSLDL